MRSFIFYVFLSSLKTQEDFRKLPSYAFPSSFQLANYKRVLEVSPIVTYFKNSIIILVFTLAVLLVISSMAGFALAKIKFKRNQFMLNYFMLGLMLPCQVALIPLYFQQDGTAEHICGHHTAPGGICIVLLHSAVLFLQQVHAQ